MTSCFNHETITPAVAIFSNCVYAHTHLQTGATRLNSWKFLICSAPSARRPNFCRQGDSYSWNPPQLLWTMNGGRAGYVHVSREEEKTFTVVQSWRNSWLHLFSHLMLISLMWCVAFRDLLHDLEKCNADPVAIAECFVSKVIKTTLHPSICLSLVTESIFGPVDRTGTYFCLISFKGKQCAVL